MQHFPFLTVVLSLSLPIKFWNQPPDLLNKLVYLYTPIESLFRASDIITLVACDVKGIYIRGFKILLRDYPRFKVMGCHVTFLFSNFTAAVSFRPVVHSWVRSPYLEDARSGKVPFIRRVFGNPGVVDLRTNFFNAGCICASLPLIHTELHMYAKVISYL